MAGDKEVEAALAHGVTPDALKKDYHVPPQPYVPPEAIMQFFSYAHLKDTKMVMVSRCFCELAEYVVENVPRNPERTVALRKILEAKDAAVRACIYKP